MDKHSEVEAKFDAKKLTTGDIHSYLIDNSRRLTLESFREVGGWDSYYRQGDNMVRHRCDGRRKTSVLTCKKRKSESSITDRHEVDMYIREDMKAPDVAAFLKMAGFEHFFTIEKNSYIWNLKADGVHVCLALYDVWGRESQPDGRFLEIEIEKDADLAQDLAPAALQKWVDELKLVFNLEDPLNASLFEMYAPKCLRREVVLNDGNAPACKLHFKHGGDCKVK